MKRPKRSGELPSEGPGEALQRLGGVLVDWVFKSWKGYSRAQAEEYKRWEGIQALLPVVDPQEQRDWLAQRESELRGAATVLDPIAYSRARLEDYCRRQGVSEDGRPVVQLPVAGLSRETLQGLGMLVDPFERMSDAADYTVVLPQGYSFEPAPDSERWAGVLNEDGVRVVDVLHSCTPFGYGAGTGRESRTQLPYIEQPAG